MRIPEEVHELEPSMTCTDSPLTLLHRAIELGARFKADETVYQRRGEAGYLRDLLVTDLPDAGTDLWDLLEEFETQILPWCKNEASPRFLGFADTGDDPASLMGEILAILTQQNLINQGFDSPSATFVDVSVLRWLRLMLGYPNPPVHSVTSVWDVGGIVTTGGTTSNTVAMMLARERHSPGTMHTGVAGSGEMVVLVPAGIGHYSVKSALSWIGLGDATVEVPTRSFRYDPPSLTAALTAHRGRIAAVVAYAGDSRTQTVEHLDLVRDLVRRYAPNAWLHADACWGLAAACSPLLSDLLAGIADYDSITVDPHKVLSVPYSISALLVRDPQTLRSISSHSDLIMQEDFAFGQVTPFVGSRPWASLKLWMMMRHHGRGGLARIVQDRITLRDMFVEMIDADERLLRLHEPDLTAVAFVYLPRGIRPGQASAQDVEVTNRVNVAIHDALLDQGRWFLHQFGLPDDEGRLRRGAVVRPLRFLAGNGRVTDRHVREALDAVIALGQSNESG
ncbi:MAG: L-2,4-diaminobutyrate decarboxylase [Actinomycetota bacterium]|nr:L-2,4-diaminobutyrate decarboxylase [Actinomycetota bacterium]